ncbi:peptide ABC transporter substrate-binding protein [uncultured Oscillibacter sp.]|jgi:oligopeptide transport system substrate-binding protein|uniref:peptide ABC transporter substrate-binding protein n=1 Tax=uncultured Oscillibacter sp. TaxID=876091 RepID=UPI0025E4D35E|nr:peptide ABC transporter substrate-binding protein [uncultured Oscillibacter sp.]
MKQFVKRLTALLLSAALCAVPLSGCAQDGAGMALSVCVGNAPESLDPIYAEDTSGQTVLAHLYENLMRVTADSTGKTSVIPGIAKSVDQEEETKEGAISVTYTFRLRSARWSDGQPVTAGDFVYAWQRLADPARGSRYADLLSVVSGYREARASGDMSLLKVTAKNDNTLVVVLNGHYDWFIKEVCTSPATMPLREDVVQRLKTASGSQSWWEGDPTQLVTNGPYTVAALEENRLLQLEANDRYYAAQPGPQSIAFHFAGSAEEAWSLYESKTVDAVWPLPDARLTELAADPEWSPLPELSTYAALFNCASDLFSDPALREALTLAIDRAALAQAAGAAALPAEGVVPPGVPENEEEDFRSLGSGLLDNAPETYEDRCRQARALLEEAGYNSGADLGEQKFLYLKNDVNDAVAQLLCQQWQEVLGIQVTPSGLTERNLMAALRSGEYTLAGRTLTASANDAECFLMSWTTESRENLVYYENSAYDTLMKIVAGAADGTARMGCLHDAEALLLMNFAFAPLYTKGTDWELRETLTGAFRDPRGWFSFANVVARTP